MKINALLATIILVLVVYLSHSVDAAPLKALTALQPPTRPVVLIPGIGGSSLKARRKGTKGGSDDDILVWVRAVYADSVFREHMWATFNTTSMEVESLHPEYEIYAPDDNYGLSSVSVLAPELLVAQHKTYYFQNLVDRFTEIGFEPGKTLFGFPFDWRQSLRSPTVLNALRNKIKLAYNTANANANAKSKTATSSTTRHKIKVDIVSHSMGCLLMKTL